MAAPDRHPSTPPPFSRSLRSPFGRAPDEAAPDEWGEVTAELPTDLDGALRTQVSMPALAQAVASDDVLTRIEQLALALDAHDPWHQYPDNAQAAVAAARRQTLLIELDIAGLLSRTLATAARARLIALRLPTLLAYHDAAMDLFRYFATPARARLIATAPPSNLLDSEVSLDWFRIAAGPRSVDDCGDAWLARCEASFVETRLAGTQTGAKFIRLEGRMWRLRYRPEVGSLPRLWRAEPA